MAFLRRLRLVAAVLLLVGLGALVVQHFGALWKVVEVAARGGYAYWPVVLVMLGAGGLLWTAGAAARTRAAQSLRRDVRPLSALAVTGMIVFTVAAGVVVTLLLYREAGATGAKDPVALRIDAIKTGVTVALGTGGGAVFLIAIRRQWLSERGQAFTESDQLVRRRNELYAGAIGHIDSTSMPVRLGGVESLGLLGLESPEHRDRIIRVLCAYLREPYDDTAATPELRSEAGVRQAAQDVLLRLVSAVSAGDTPPDLNLSGATLIELRLSDARLGACNFTGCRFTGTTLLNRTVFAGAAVFAGAEFTGSVRLEDARFEKFAEFQAKRCAGGFSALRADFSSVRFDGMEFGGDALFAEATFRTSGWFNSCRFGGTVDFTGITSAQRLRLSRAEVTAEGMYAQHTWPTGWRSQPSDDERTAALTETS